MPQYLPPPHDVYRPPPAFVRSVDDDTVLAGGAGQWAGKIEVGLPAVIRDGNWRGGRAGEVSNRRPDDALKVIYINGMNTTALEAQESCNLVCRNLGVSQDNVLLLYNPCETSTCVGLLKVSGGIVSSRLGHAMERECVTALRRELDRVIKSDTKRLLVVGHSQGSVIFQNATDACYDSFAQSTAGRRRWEAATGRIEAIFYAPVVRHVAPGIEAAGFAFDRDLPRVGGTSLSAIVAFTKSHLGWRPYRPFEMIVQPYESCRRTSTNLLSSHSILSLILEDARFNVELYGTEVDGSYSAELLAARLAHSIRNGLRSDSLHRDMIETATANEGPVFAQQFLRRMQIVDGEGCVKEFQITPNEIKRLRQCAAEQSARRR